MVERVQGAIIDKIQKLNQLRANPSQYPATLKAIKELVVAFNNYELQRLVSVSSSNSTCSFTFHAFPIPACLLNCACLINTYD